jgi:hypothetical protein
MDRPRADLSVVFHRLNNQLGIILANAELLEARVTEETQRARAGQVVAGALDAISTIQKLRQLLDLRTPASDPPQETSAR